MRLSRSTARPARRRSRTRRAWSGAPIAVSVPPGRSARRTPVRCSISPNSPCRRPRRGDYLALLAAGLDLVDAVKDIGKALHDQAKLRCDNGDSCPATRFRPAAPCATGMTRLPPRCPHQLGLARDDDHRRDDALAEASRTPRKSPRPQSPNRIDRFASAPASRWCGAENARAPVPGRSEIVRSFSAALAAFQEGGNA